MKKTVLLLLGGLLFISLSQGSNSQAAEQNSCAAVSHHQACHVTSEVANHTVMSAPTAFTPESEPVEEQEIGLSGRLLQLFDAFAKLVMVI